MGWKIWKILTGILIFINLICIIIGAGYLISLIFSLALWQGVLIYCIIDIVVFLIVACHATKE